LLVLLACSAGGVDSADERSRPWFTSGQPAEVLLGGFGFDNAGGAAVFNRPRGIASDGVHLAVADSSNHRVLLWSQLPTTGGEPDGVLGQADFFGNDSRELIWPVAVGMGGGKLVVGDTYNDRFLVWTSWPETADQPPDLILEGVAAGEPLPDFPAVDSFVWPWGIWTDGDRLVVSSTMFEAVQGDQGGRGWVLIWNSFPQESGAAADLVLSAGGEMGTPRGISTDGSWLAVGDHNASGQDSEQGTWVWSSWPDGTETPPDAFLTEPDNGSHWLAGTGNRDGSALLAGGGLYLWNGAPEMGGTDLTLDAQDWGFRGGDGIAAAMAGDQVWITDPDANRVVAFDSWPSTADARPDRVLGADDLASDAVADNHLISNGVPATDGEILCVGDGYNLRIDCWKALPSGEAPSPDVTLSTGDGIEGLALHRDTLVAAGPVRGVQIWYGVPWEGRAADELLGNRIAGTDVGQVSSLAMDDHYLYVVDRGGMVHGFTGVGEGEPGWAFSLSIDPGGAFVHTDGQTLTVATQRDVTLYDVATLAGEPEFKALPAGDWSGSLGQAAVCDDRLFLVDQGAHRVYGWQDVQDAVAGTQADILLGAADWDDRSPQQSQADLFWPRLLAFDGRTLWVAEYKFGGRVLGFVGW
jgi:hypothetical protein